MKNPKIAKLGLNFAGVGIGDGLTSPIDQLKFYSKYLFSVGMIDTKTLDKFIKVED